MPAAYHPAVSGQKPAARFSECFLSLHTLTGQQGAILFLIWTTSVSPPRPLDEKKASDRCLTVARAETPFPCWLESLAQLRPVFASRPIFFFTLDTTASCLGEVVLYRLFGGASLPFRGDRSAAQVRHRNRESSAHPWVCFRAADFTEVVFKSAAYRLSGRACQFLFMELSRSGSQTISANLCAYRLTALPRRCREMANTRESGLAHAGLHCVLVPAKATCS